MLAIGKTIHKLYIGILNNNICIYLDSKDICDNFTYRTENIT